MNKLQADRADSCIDSMLVYSKSEVDDYIAELEKERDVRDLEQQISALTFALENITKAEDIYCRRKELRKQAAKLKEQE